MTARKEVTVLRWPVGILEVYDIPQALAENSTQRGVADRLFRGWAELSVPKKKALLRPSSSQIPPP